MASFDEATAVQGTNGTYEAELDPEWTVSGNPHGGYLLAVMARAAISADDSGAHPHPLSASAVYAYPPEVGPATITVEALRRGRTASQMRARLTQKDRTHVEALFTIGRLDETVHWVDGPPVEVAPWDACPRSQVEPPGAGVRVEMLDLVEQRLDTTSFRAPGVDPAKVHGFAGGSGDIRGWLQFTDGTPVDPVGLLYVADGFPPATLTIGSVGWVPTLELTVYVRGVPAPGPLRVRQRARVLAGNLVDQVCEAWDSRDRVVVQATQLAGVRMRQRESL